MARIAVIEDSDDEFPEISKILKASPKKIIGRGVAAATSRSRESNIQAPREKTGKLLTSEEPIPTPMEHEGVEDVRRKQKPRKRVLNQRTENPLLRPITSTSAASSGFLPSEKKKETVKPTEKRTPVVRSKRAASKPVLESEGDEETVKPTERGESVVRRKRVVSKPVLESEEDEDEDEESDGMSDFIVSDNSSLGEDEDEIVERMPPRSTRKLVRGRRPQTDIYPVDELNLDMIKLTVEDPFDQLTVPTLETMMREFDDTREKKGTVKTRRGQVKEVSDDVYTKGEKPAKDIARPRRRLEGQSSDIEDPFTLRFSPPQSKPRKMPKGEKTVFTTPPASPEIKPKGLTSPSKKPPRIPNTPHRPSMDTFWDQDAVNDWNDEYSPRKETKPTSKPQIGEDEDTSGGALLLSPTKKSPVKQDKAARAAKKAFSEMKHTVAQSFFYELDEKITQNRITEFCAATGGVKIFWSNKLCSTAGRAHWKRETIKSTGKGPDGNPAPPTYRDRASIELAEKIVDDEDKLLNVIAHEFCHLATFMISNMKTNPHGREFKAWGARCSHVFRDRGIDVTTKHTYEIDYRYVWECENCGQEYKRHSKSIDVTRHRCGRCKSKLVQMQPAPGKERKASEYQIFVKENMRRIKKENPGSPQKEMMGLVAKEYKEYKALKLSGVNGDIAGVDLEGGGSGRELSLEAVDKGVVGGVVGGVVKELDYLEL